MSLYIPGMTDEFGNFVQGLADNFGLLADSLIVEQGENENGEYWRYENGLQICRYSTNGWLELEENVQHGERYLFSNFPSDFLLKEGSYGTLIWTFPADFIIQPACHIVFIGRHASAFTALKARHEILSFGTGSVQFELWNSGGGYANGSSYAILASLFAIGRWK